MDVRPAAVTRAAKSVEELDVVSTTAAGNYRGFVEMGADAVLTVLASAI